MNPYARITALILVAVLIFFAIPQWLDTGSFHVLAGDDVRGFTYAGEGFQSINAFFIRYFRYRPVQAFIESLCANLSGGEYDKLKLVAASVHTLNALLVFWLLVRSIKLPLFIAVGVTLLATFSRYTNYLIMAETGIMESLAVTFYILFMWALLSLLYRPRLLVAAIAAACFVLNIHLHERYLVLLVPGLVVAALIYKGNRRISLFLAAAIIAAASLNLLIKTVVLSTSVLIGTTTQAIDFSITPKIIFFVYGILNLLGINRGPSYLSVFDYLESPVWLKVVCLLSAGLCVWLLIGAIRTSRQFTKRLIADNHHSGFRSMVFVLCTLTAVMVLSASITFRQEYRWMYPGYVTFLVLLGVCAQYWTNARHNPTPHFLFFGLLLCAIPRELAIRSQRGNFYQYLTCQTASDLYETVIRSPSLASAKVITIGGDDVPSHDWVFMDGMFSDYYKIPPLQFVDSSAIDGTTSPPTLVRYNYAQRKFSPAPRGADGTVIPEYKSQILGKSLLLGTPENTLSTPNGRRLFPFSSGGYDGWAIVAPAELTVEAPAITRTLYVSFSHIWKKAAPVHLEILAVDQKTGSMIKLLSASIPPLQSDASPEWQDYRIPLPIGCTKLRISVNPKTGDPTATWLVFRQLILQ